MELQRIRHDLATEQQQQIRGRDPRELFVTCRMAETLTLNITVSLRLQRMLRVVVWDFKAEGGN